MADVEDRCLGSQRFAGQDEVMADAVFESVKKQKANGKSWWWQCMSVVLVTESDADPILCKLQCKLCKQLLSPSNPPDACKTHLKSTVCKGHHVGVREGLIPQGQQHQAAGSSSNGQTGGISSGIGFKRQATLPPGQLRIDDMKKTRELAKEHLAMFLYKNSLPLKLIEDPDLKKCFSLLGVELPTR